MDDQACGLHAAILAAGPRTRLEGIKPLVRLRGEPVLHELAANAAFVAGQSVTVVIGAHAKEIAPNLIGEDPSDIQKIFDKLVWAGASMGRSGMTVQAISPFSQVCVTGK